MAFKAPQEWPAVSLAAWNLTRMDSCPLMHNCSRVQGASTDMPGEWAPLTVQRSLLEGSSYLLSSVASRRCSFLQSAYVTTSRHSARSVPHYAVSLEYDLLVRKLCDPSPSRLTPFLPFPPPYWLWHLPILPSHPPSPPPFPPFSPCSVKRRPQSILFLGLSGADGRVPPSRLVVLHHGKKEASDALELAAHVPSDSEVASELKRMVKMGLHKAGLDMAGAELSQVLTWRGAPRTEVVSGYKAGVYEMQGVAFRIKSRRVLGPEGETDGKKGEGKKGEEEGLKGKAPDQGTGSSRRTRGCEEDNGSDADEEDEEDGDYGDDGRHDNEDVEGVLTEEERRQWKEAMRGGDDDAGQGDGEDDEGRVTRGTKQEERRGWFGRGKGGGSSSNSSKDVRYREGSASGREDSKRRVKEEAPDRSDVAQADERDGRQEGAGGDSEAARTGESEFRRGLKPLLWLTGDFPLES